MRVPAAAFEGEGEVERTQKSPSGALRQRNEQIGLRWALRSVRGRGNCQVLGGPPTPCSGSVSSLPALARDIEAPCRGSVVPKRQAAWRTAPRFPFRLRLRRQRLQGALPPWPRGPWARSGPETRRRCWHAPGSFEAQGLAGPEQRRRIGSGSRRWLRRTKAPKEPRGGRAAQPGTKEAAECSGLCAGPTKPRPPPSPGAQLGAPCRAQASSCSTSAPKLGARPALTDPPAPPPLSSRAGGGAICPPITIPPHKPPPAPFNSGALANQWPSARLSRPAAGARGQPLSGVRATIKGPAGCSQPAPEHPQLLAHHCSRAGAQGPRLRRVWPLT